MKRHASEEAFYQRLKELAEVNKPLLKDNIRNLGTLIDYKRAADGIAYGIVKENHNYYIKKAGIKQDPNIADFAYIGGLSNIKEFQYSKLSEAEKQRNMIFGTINEGRTRMDKNGSKKKKLNEDKVSKEIDNAESKMGDLEAATNAEAVPEPTPEPEMGLGDGAPADASTEPAPDGSEEGLPPAGDGSEEGLPPAGDEVPPTDDAAPAPEGDEEGLPPAGDEEPPAGDGSEEGLPPTGDETGEEQPAGDEEVDKLIGKLGEKVRKTDMEDNIVAGNLKSIIAAYKPKLKTMDIEDRKEIADGILKVVGDDEVEDLGNSVEQDEPKTEPETGIEEDQCAECGGFGKYAESRGYSNPEAFMECGGEEQANVVNGYVGASEEGMNDGDEKTISLVIKLAPEVLDKLKSDYGRDDYAEKMQPQVDSMNESNEEDIMTQLKEAWGGGIGRMAGDALKGAGKGIAGAAKGAVKGIGNAAQGVKQGATNAYNTVKTGVGNAVDAAKQSYQAGSQAQDVRSGIKGKNAALGKLEALAADLGKQIAAANAGAVKAGQPAINVNSIIQTLSNQLRGSNSANLSKYKSEGTIPADQTQVQPNMLKEEKEEDEPETDEPETDTPEVDNIETSEETPETGEETSFETGEETPEIDVDDVTSEPEPEEKPSFSFSPDSQSLGGGVVKPDGAGVEIRIEPDKTVTLNMNEAKKKLIKQIAEGVNAYLKEGAANKNLVKPIKKALAKPIKKGVTKPAIVMSESEQKLRKYIRARLEEHAGIRKPSLNEGKKSETLKRLDNVIDNQFKLFEAVALKKKDKLNEVFGFSVAEKFASLDPNNELEVNKLFQSAFKNILINPHMSTIGTAAKRATAQEKYALLQQYVDGNGGTLRVDRVGKLIYASKQFQDTGIKTPTAAGSTGLSNVR